MTRIVDTARDTTLSNNLMYEPSIIASKMCCFFYFFFSWIRKKKKQLNFNVPGFSQQGRLESLCVMLWGDAGHPGAEMAACEPAVEKASSAAFSSRLSVQNWSLCERKMALFVAGPHTHSTHNKVCAVPLLPPLLAFPWRHGYIEKSFISCDWASSRSVRPR